MNDTYKQLVYMATDCILAAHDVVQRRTHLKVIELGGPKETGNYLAGWDRWHVARGEGEENMCRILLVKPAGRKEQLGLPR
jgi:hypothetical protein